MYWIIRYRLIDYFSCFSVDVVFNSDPRNSVVLCVVVYLSNFFLMLFNMFISYRL